VFQCKGWIHRGTSKLDPGLRQPMSKINKNFLLVHFVTGEDRLLIWYTISLNSTYRGLVVHFVTGEDCLLLHCFLINCTYRGLFIHFVTGEDWLLLHCFFKLYLPGSGRTVHFVTGEDWLLLHCFFINCT